MRIYKEGDKGRAPHPDLGRMVDIVYQRRWFHYTPEDVEVFAIVGVCVETDEALVIPPQSEPDVGAAIRAKAAAKQATTPSPVSSAGG